MSKHVAIWIDHKEARVFHISADSVDEKNVHAHSSDVGAGHGAAADHFFHEVAKSVANAEEILVVGPSTGKLDFIKHVHKHDHALEPKIVGVETVDHPTDGQLVAYARKYFKARDRMI